VPPYTAGNRGTPGSGDYSVVVVGEIASVTVTPGTATILQDGTQQFTAKAFDADGHQVTSAAFTWESSAPTIAEIHPTTGLATGRLPGDAPIIAKAPNGVEGRASLHVDEPPPPPDLPPVRISEIHYDNSGEDAGEAIEIEGPTGTDLTGWKIVLYNGNGGTSYGITRTLTGTIPPTCDARGVVFVSYLPNGIQNGGTGAPNVPDGVALVDAAGNVVEFLSYEGTFTAVDGPANGLQSTDIRVLESSSSPADGSLQRGTSGNWRAPERWTFGACNNSSGLLPPPVTTFSGRAADDVPIPVGFEDQLFATLRTGGTTVPTTFTWSSETPEIASVDQDGVVRALAAGVALIRATAADGTMRTVGLLTRVSAASTTAQYAGNAEFGEPKDGNASDDFIIRRPQYTASYNKTRGIPNWVSYNIDATHFGGEDRCDCFTFDPVLLAQGFTSYTTADYTGAGTFHGYGIDRGHLARSFDRTSGSLDNATTFYFTNIIPQAARLNQGPWAVMETDLGDLARFQNKEVYIIAGGAGVKGTVKNEGKITIPAYVWKVAVILPRNQGLPDVDDYEDPEVIAVVVPNDSTSTNRWETYKTTVDSVEALSGYDLLPLLDDQIEIAVESNTKPPVAATNGPYNSIEGESVTISGAASHDPDGDALTYAWNFGDGSTASGVTVSHTYTTGGDYTVTLEVTDIRGLKATTTTTATVLTRVQATRNIGAFVYQLVATSKLAAGNGNALNAKLEAAAAQFVRGGIVPAVNQLEAFLHQVDALVSSNRLSDTNANVMRATITRVIRSASS
jgi:DNA/RNA endonuclease G (NUC1)